MAGQIILGYFYLDILHRYFIRCGWMMMMMMTMLMILLIGRIFPHPYGARKKYFDT